MLADHLARVVTILGFSFSTISMAPVRFEDTSLLLDPLFFATDFFEGDIMGVDPEAMDHSKLAGSLAKNGVTNEHFRWPNRTLPYKFSQTFEQDLESKNIVLLAMKGFEDNTCIRFVPRTTEEDYLKIASWMGTCSSYVGKVNGSQWLILSVTGCLKKKGIVQHELMHAIGFYHEQARLDRDDFVDINWPNIPEERKIEFLKYENTTAFNQKYDFDSVMHYGENYFAKDEKVWTMKAKRQFGAQKIGQRTELSQVDIKKINLMYKCSSALVTSTPRQTSPSSTVTKKRANFGISKIPPTSRSMKLTKTKNYLDPVFDTPHRGCYLPTWSLDRSGSARFTTHDVVANLCTYIIIAYGIIDDDSSLQLEIETDTGIFEKLNVLKEENRNLKIFLSVGAKNTSEKLSRLSSKPENRRKFVSSVVENLRLWDIDGLDIAFGRSKKPTTSGETLLPILLAELRSAFTLESIRSEKKRLALSVTLRPTPLATSLYASQLEKSVDIANVVAYDQGNTNSDLNTISHHSPLFQGPLGVHSDDSMESVLKLWASCGISKSKLVAGIPFYGHGWLLENPDDHQLGAAATSPIQGTAFTEEFGVWPFYGICQKIKSDGATVVFDETIGASYAYTESWWVGYNDQETVWEKTTWVRNNGFGGVYVWDLSQDDFKDLCGHGKNPLLVAIRNAQS